MELTFGQIKDITTGAVRITQENGLVKFYRFTKEQEELYKKTNDGFYHKTFFTAGIKLLFKTDSENLFLKIHTEKGAFRQYFSVDVFVDGEPEGYIDNFSECSLKRDYTNTEAPSGSFSKQFKLKKGEKTVCVHLPWSVTTLVEQILLDDNATVEAVKPEHKLLAFGDSITHGYDALRPSNRYVARLAQLIDAQEYNKAIGGERFFPALACLKEEFEPDYITVAYGTNDWFLSDEETFKTDCNAFYTTLSRNYPKSKIFAITPIWRKDLNEPKPVGEFQNVEEHIRNVTEVLDNVMVISGINFVPHDEKYYADLRLHPTDDGFEYYAKGLFEELKLHI